MTGRTTRRLGIRSISLSSGLVFQRIVLVYIFCGVLMLLTNALAYGQSETVYESTTVQIGHFTILGEYLGYDNGYSTYHYHIENNGGKALGFFQIGFCDQIKAKDVEIIDKTGFQNGKEAIELLYHDKTDIYGLKAEAIEDRKPQVFDLTFKIKGYWPPDINQAAIHAGNGQTYPKGDILGPGCPETSCSVCCNETNELYWQIAKPGIFATKAMQLKFTGYGQAVLRFEGFTDLVKIGSEAGPDIPVSYGIGATLEEVEEFGWRPATTRSIAVGINDTVYSITLTGDEKVVYIWSKLDVDPGQRSGNYTGDGRVYVELQCGRGD